MPKRPTAVTLSLDECEPNALPPVCVKCGAEATGEKTVQFKWQPPWVVVTILAGLLIFLILTLVLRKKRTAYLPVCDLHSGVWNWSGRIAFFVLLAFLLAAFTLALAFGDQRGATEAWGFAWFCLGAFLVGGLIVAAVAQSRGPQVSRITDERMKISRLDPDFVEAVREQQDGDKAANLAWRAARTAGEPRA